MHIVLLLLVGVALLGTLAVLFAGVITLAQPNHDPRRSNVLMRWRVVLQGTALLLLAILLLLARG
ncbi:MAG TPA: twin transmembrane helix small protein [Acetobacteraceae bacterium]|nr:twin transmembrane helix small protein [Acetobacteraceae bacterium]